MSTDDMIGREIIGDHDAIRTQIIRLSQDVPIPPFWCPKRIVRNMPKGIRPWSVFEKRPQMAVIVYEKALLDIGCVRLRYLDGQDVVIPFEDFMRCGTIVDDRTTVTKMYTIRMPGERDMHGHTHE